MSSSPIGNEYRVLTDDERLLAFAGDVAAVGSESSTGKAIARRFGLPLRYDYTFAGPDGGEVMVILKRTVDR